MQLFITYRPAWVNKDGWPLSWQHYIYGLRHIAREDLRRQLWYSQAARLSRGNEDQFGVFQRDINRLTEVPNG